MASRNSVRLMGCSRNSLAPARMQAITVSPSAWKLEAITNRSGAACLTFSMALMAPSGSPGEIDDQAGAGMPLQVLQHADVEVGGDLLVLRGHLGVGNVEQVVANHLAEMFVARSDHQCGVRHGDSLSHGRQFPDSSGSPRFPWARWW